MPDNTRESDEKIRVATLAELKDKPVKLVRGDNHNIAVFYDEGEVFAVDNRCPHMGFPLDRGSVKDGILTCHWHQARFDLKSGCTFDLWADDVLRFATCIIEDEVYVSSRPDSVRTEAFYRQRLIQGMEQNVPLVQAKSLLAVLDLSQQRAPDQAAVDHGGNGSDDLGDLVSDIVSYAARNLATFSEGMTRLGCISNLAPHLGRDTLYQGLLYATRQIANETTLAVPHRKKDALQGEVYDLARLKAWLRQWVMTRHRDGTERTLLTGISLPSDALSDLLFGAASERLYADGGHLFEACNKVLEMAARDVTPAEALQRLLPLLVESLTQSGGMEENTNWHHPIDIVSPIRELDKRLPSLLANNSGDADIDPDLSSFLLGDDPLAILRELEKALAGNVAPLTLAREVSYAAALRLARFATSNEVTDWFNPQHSYIHTNAVYQAVKRNPSPEVVRAIFQGAMSVYMDRFLNVPAAKLPSERNVVGTFPKAPEDLLGLLLQTLDQRSNIDQVAEITAHYISSGHAMEQLIDTLVLATVREDLDFHSLQVLDAAVSQMQAWQDPTIIENIFVGVVRNLAAHCPTRRAGQQTAKIASKLQKGELIFEEA